MINPEFFLQKGDLLRTEKFACICSPYQCHLRSIDEIAEIDAKLYRFTYVPVGSVEFTREYARKLNIPLPESGLFFDFLEPFLNRKVRLGNFSEAKDFEFVKPASRVKSFTGDLKENLIGQVNEDEKVWISEPVVFESEFRFYIHDFVTGPKILGWSRYDDLPVRNPDPDVKLVEKIAQRVHQEIGPSAYSIDIGWMPRIQEYALVELNDGWSLGLYDNSDPQSKPPSRQDYAEMLISRWRQILFCAICDEM